MSEPLTILIVDDDPAEVTAARALLARRGCRVETVFKAMDALARIRAGGVDAVLLDVWMPEVDGLSALDEIASLPNPPRVVLMSGNIDARVEAAVTSGKAVACLEKPVDFELAHTLLFGLAPEVPLQLHARLENPALGAMAAQILARGAAFLEGAPQLPPGTAVSLLLGPLPAGAGAKEVKDGLRLLAVADPSVRAAGKRGLGMKVADLTALQQEKLRSFSNNRSDAAPAIRDERPGPSPADRAHELYQRGLERLEAGKYDRALLDLQRARDMAPGDPLLSAAHRLAVQLAGSMRARELFREAETLAELRPEEALQLLEDAMRLDPTRASYHLEAARLYLQTGELLKAEECLATAVHLAPSDPAPRIHHAQLLERAARPREALWAAETALLLFPGEKELLKLATRLRRKVDSAPPAG